LRWKPTPWVVSWTSVDVFQSWRPRNEEGGQWFTPSHPQLGGLPPSDRVSTGRTRLGIAWEPAPQPGPPNSSKCSDGRSPTHAFHSISEIRHLAFNLTDSLSCDCMTVLRQVFANASLVGCRSGRVPMGVRGIKSPSQRCSFWPSTKSVQKYRNSYPHLIPPPLCAMSILVIEFIGGLEGSVLSCSHFAQRT
jgi:hypothetical protein